MYKMTGTYILNVFTFMAGVIFMILHDQPNLMEYMVILIGLLHIIPSIAVIINSLAKQNDAVPSVGAVVGLIIPVCAIFIGLVLISNPVAMVDFIAYAMLLILIISGLYHILFILMCDKKYQFSIWFYILPILPVIAGATLFFMNPLESQSLIVLITGASLVLFTLNTVVEFFRIRRKNKQERARLAENNIAETIEENDIIK